MRVVRVGRGEDAQAWAEALARFDAAGADVLKEDETRGVYRARMGGRTVIVKRWEVCGLWARARAWARLTAADRHWRAARWLTRHGIATARCLALALERQKHTGPWLRVWLVMEAVEGQSVLHWLARGNLGARDQQALVRAVAAQAGQLYAQGRCNRDHKPSNLIALRLDPTADQKHAAPGRTWRVAMVDCAGLRRWGQAARMLAAMMIEPMGCGVGVRRALWARGLEAFVQATGTREPEASRRTKRRLAQAVARLVSGHGDPAPRIDPLARGVARDGTRE